MLPLSLCLLVGAMAVAGRELLSAAQQAPVADARPTLVSRLQAAPVSAEPVVAHEAVVATPAPLAAQPLQGYYVGEFIADATGNDPDYQYNTKLNLALEKLEDGEVSGFSVVYGIKRPFTGTYSERNGSYVVTASEPGDRRLDGDYAFTLSPRSQAIKGFWRTRAVGQPRPRWRFELHAKAFAYDPQLMLAEHDILTPGGGAAEVFGTYNPVTDQSESLTLDAAKFNTSTTRLSSADVENLYRRDLEILRHTIYARHGLAFKDPVIRHYFDQIDWYVPLKTDVSDELTALELANIDLISRYERYAERYYQHFGR